MAVQYLFYEILYPWLSRISCTRCHKPCTFASCHSSTINNINNPAALVGCVGAFLTVLGAAKNFLHDFHYVIFQKNGANSGFAACNQATASPRCYPPPPFFFNWANIRVPWPQRQNSASTVGEHTGSRKQLLAVPHGLHVEVLPLVVVPTPLSIWAGGRGDFPQCGVLFFPTIKSPTFPMVRSERLGFWQGSRCGPSGKIRHCRAVGFGHGDTWHRV